MNAKEFLRQYEYANRKVVMIKRELVELESAYDQIRSVTDYDGMSHGSNIGHPTEEKAIKVTDAKMKYSDLLQERYAIRQQVFDVIVQVDGVEGDILYYRYINLLSWWEICDRIGYEWTQTHERHRRALTEVDKIINSEHFRTL